MPTRTEWTVNGLVIAVPVLVLVAIVLGGTSSGWVVVPVFLAFLGASGAVVAMGVAMGVAICRSRAAAGRTR